ncbi:MAG: nucleotide exchange factor GrpE [Anaerolineae bacterium]|nr:nucleotide exchange factor GrpE [Anaerolineae bacterium]
MAEEQPTTEAEEPVIEAAEEEKEQEEGAEAPESPADLAALRQELEETKVKEAEYLDGWQRARAELANARKRFQREQEQAYANAAALLLTRLLPIVDDLERAFSTLPHNLSGLTWIGGILLIQRKLELLLEQEGVVPIEAVGQAFDPFAHEAVTHEPSDTVPEEHVISELQKGYKMGDRVLRPALVRVSSGPAPQPKVVSEPAEAPDQEPADEN